MNRITESYDYANAFKNYIRLNQAPETMNNLSEGSYSSNFYQFPDDVRKDFRKALAEHNLFRAYGQVYTVISDGVIHTVSSMAEARLTNENEAYPEENDSFLRQNYGAFKLARLSKLPINFVKDAHFDLERYLQTDFARSFGKAEDRILMNGEGGEEPKGLLATAEVGIRHSEATGNLADDLIALFFSLDEQYRDNAVWLMNDKTALRLRQLVDNSGRYLLDTSPTTILDKPVLISNTMPDLEQGNKAIAFGNLSYFWIVERAPLSVQVLREKFIVDGHIGFAAQERLDGKLIKPDAVKTLEVTV